MKHLHFGRVINQLINPYGFVIEKPEIIHSTLPSGGPTFSRRIFIMNYFHEQVKEVKGDILEIGVHWGEGLLCHLHGLQFNNNRRIIGFDSFQGHSQPNKKDYLGGKFYNFKNSFAITQDDVFQTLRVGTNYSDDDLKKFIELIPGWVQDTMPEFRKKYQNEQKKIALCHCDVDIYEPYCVGLHNTWEILNQNGIIIIGILNNPQLMGKTEAVREFIAKLPKSSYDLKEIDIRDNGLVPVKLSYLIKKD